MSENLRGTQARLANAIQETIYPDMVDFENLSQSTTVQQFCTYDARFNRDTLADSPKEYLTKLLEEPEITVFSSAEVVSNLTNSSKRLDDFIAGMTGSYCNRKRLPLPQDEQQQNAILAKIFNGGLAKVVEYMRWSNVGEEGITNIANHDQMKFLPLSLILLGARLSSSQYYESVDGSLEATSTQEEIDTNIDQALQAACVDIQQNKKLISSKTDSEHKKAFTASMNCLRTAYNLHQDASFKALLFAFYHPIFGSVEAEEPEEYLECYQTLREYFGQLIDTPMPEITDPRMAIYAISQANKKTMKIYEDNDTMDQTHSDIEYKLLRTRSAHWLVDNIANGSMKYSDIRKAMMLLNSQPLKQRQTHNAPSAQSQELGNEFIDWQILPPDLFDDEGNPRIGEGQQDPYDHERQIDWARLWRLQKYGRSWTGSRMARSNIPDLPKDKQYYAVILPEALPDGTYVEHAVADHPETGNGMYVWRAEVGIEDGRVFRTWEHVMAQPRTVARKLGARCLYHTAGLETNLFDYLTRKPNQLASKRYAKL